MSEENDLKFIRANLYIFRPIEWSYCGGTIIVKAKTFERAIKIIKESSEDYSDHKFFEDRNDKDIKEDSSGQWLLEATFVLDEDEEEGIVLDDWNWA